MKPKLILTDLDGTLLDDQKTVPPANLEALARAAAQGAQVVVATGRFYPAVPQALKDLPFLRYFILMNGAKVWDRTEDRTIYRAEISPDTADRFFRLLEPLDATADCMQDDLALMARRYYDQLDYYILDPVVRRTIRSTRQPVEDPMAVIRANGRPLQKLQCHFPHPEQRPQVMELLARELPELVQTSSLPTNLELNAVGASKGAALLALCRHLSLDPAEAVAFGDSDNDLTMLRAAGIGVAMANGNAEALSAADLIAPSNNEAGVAQVLRRWF